MLDNGRQWKHDVVVLIMQGNLSVRDVLSFDDMSSLCVLLASAICSQQPDLLFMIAFHGFDALADVTSASYEIHDSGIKYKYTTQDSSQCHRNGQ